MIDITDLEYSSDNSPQDNPLDFVSYVATNWEIDAERLHRDCLLLNLPDGKCMMLLWTSNNRLLHLSMPLPLENFEQPNLAIQKIVLRANQELMLGRFDYAPDDGEIVFRTSHPLGQTVDSSQIVSIMEMALDACSRWHSAFHILDNKGSNVSDVLELSRWIPDGHA